MQLYDRMKDELVRVSDQEECCRKSEMSAIAKVNISD